MTLRGKSLFLQRLIYFSFFDISLIQLVWVMQVRNYKPIDNTSFSLLSLVHLFAHFLYSSRMISFTPQAFF